MCYYEILAGMWVRNGHQIRGQAMTYIQSHFCKSTIDVDIYLLQVAIYVFKFKMVKVKVQHFYSSAYLSQTVDQQ